MDLSKEGKGTYGSGWAAGVHRCFLIRFRLMHRPLLMPFSRVEGGGGASELGRHEQEEGTEGKERKGPSGFIYNEKRIKGRRKNLGA